MLYDLENCNFQTDTLISIFIFDFKEEDQGTETVAPTDQEAPTPQNENVDPPQAVSQVM